MLKRPQRSYEVDMCSGPIFPSLLKIALPLVLSNMLQYMFNATNIMVVGTFAGDNSMAAIGATTSLISLITNLFLGLSTGVNIIAAKYYGAQDLQGVRNTVDTSVLLSFLCGGAFTILSILGAPWALRITHCPSNAFDLAVVYLRVYSLSTISITVYNFGSALLRSQGDSRRPLYFLLAAGLMNLLLNLLFVGVLHWNVAGVALATVLSQTTAALLVLRCLVGDAGPLHLEPRQARFHRRELLQILLVGLPEAIQSTLFSLSNVFIQASINSFGEVTVAGNSAAESLENFIYAADVAFVQAGTAFVSQNYGAGNRKRIQRSIFLSVFCTIVFQMALALLALGFGPYLLRLFSPTEEVIAAGMRRMQVIFLFEPFCGIMDCLATFLRSMGHNFVPTVVTLVGSCALRIVWLATVFQIPAYHTIEVVYLSYPVTWIITSAAHTICLVFALRRLRRMGSPT